MTDEPEQHDPWGTPAGGSPPQGPAQPPPTAQPQYGQPPADQPQYGQPPADQPQYGQPPAGQPPYGQPPYGQQAPYPPPPPYAQPPAYGYPAPAGGYPPQQPYYGPTTSGKATTVMVVGISSIVLMFTCGLGFIAAIVALAMAPGASREIAESGGRLTGEGQIKAGKITSWITIGLSALGIVIFVIVVAAMVSEDSSNDSPTTGVRTNATSLVHRSS